ncbi:hypothetical protein [uncultured Butyricimonas sp.]|mgnify:CR=1 FL=1|uniref:hypothetical protein n=1 Tax=uncultured Butyricimonas sp. TaxID=1268785 RepID=UPI0026DCD2F5|nr:hypothetical protein [uncultured Butyricimonas sp.]
MDCASKMIQLGSMAKREIYTKIVICPHCGGEGYTKKWNDREREYDSVICTICGGMRVLRKIVRIEYEKVGNEVNKRDN